MLVVLALLTVPLSGCDRDPMAPAPGRVERPQADLLSPAKAQPSVSAGFKHNCALTPAGALDCWGRNDFLHTCALPLTGRPACWGSNGAGQLSAPSLSNRLPTASAGGGPYSGAEGVPIAFDGSGSTDPDGDALTYAWDFGDGATGSGPTPRHAYADEGSYTVTLTVSDGDGASDTKSNAAIVVNVAPTAAFGGDRVVPEGTSFTLALSDPRDAAADLAALQYAFDCGDGAGYGDYRSAASASCLAADNGDRVAKGKLRDPDGGESEYTASVGVRNALPVVNAGADRTITSGDLFTLGGSFTDAGLADGPWGWSIAWGAGQGTATGSASTRGALSAAKRYLAAGTYTVTLSVTDKDGGTGSDPLTLTVLRLGVTINVEPADAANRVSRTAAAGAVIPVAVLSTASFDALTQLGVASATLGNGAGAEAPVARRSNGTLSYKVRDVNGDGRWDVVLDFTRAALIANGDLAASTTQLVLHATLADGCQVRGANPVTVVP